MNKKIDTRLHNSRGNIATTACASFFLLLAVPAMALPSVDSKTQLSGSATYTVNTAQQVTNGAAPQGTLTFTQDNSMVSFGSDPVNIAQGETFSVLPSGGNDSWVGVIRVDSDTASQFDGILAPSMRLFILNPNGIVTGNNFSVDFSGLTNTAGALVLSTHTLDPAALGQGPYKLTSPANGELIQLDGMQVNGQGAEVLVLADQVKVSGVVNVPGGKFHAVSAGEVDVAFGVGDFIVIQSAVPAGQGDISTASTANISAAHVNLQAWVSVNDPLSLALNNQGMVSATGISVSEQGTISLVGRGGELRNTGVLNAKDAQNGAGNVAINGNTVKLGGTVLAGTLNIDIGDTPTGSDGELRVASNANINVVRAEVTGALGVTNTVSGLANYHVKGANTGSAGWMGVESSDWSNTGAATFNNISQLIAYGGIDNNFVIEQAGSLSNAAGKALLRGGARNDSFTIAGSAQLLEGLGGSDDFIMQGGLVEGFVDGGRGNDSIQNVFNVMRSGPNDIDGSSDFVSWVNIQTVLELDVPAPIPLPIQAPNLSGVIAPQVSFANVSNMSAASLGLVGAGAEPRLPCGFGSAPIAIAGHDLAHEEPCMQDYSGPEFQELISSLIHFDHDSFAITPASAARLQKVAGFFVESNAFGKVVIAAHTDDIGSEVYNLALSERRAGSTSRYMQAQGLSPDVIETFHFGEVLPAVPNTSAANRAHNRRARIELK